MGKTVKLIFLISVSALLSFPIYLMVSNSFTQSIGFLEMPPTLIPYQFTLANYGRILGFSYVGRWVANSAFLFVVLIVGSVSISGAAAYVLATVKSKTTTILYWVFLLPLFVPQITVVVARFVVLSKIGLIGMPAVVLMPLYWAVGIFLFCNGFKSIPYGFLESARLEGAGEFRIFSSIAMPLMKPIVGISVIMVGSTAFGDYMWQMLNLHKEKQMTLLVGLATNALNVNTILDDIGFDLAVGTVLFIPYIVMFIISSKYFVSGLTAGGLRA
jgi:ABC-type glycerol-3-phosphate transport system permease component